MEQETEVLVDTGSGERWWPMCSKEGCLNLKTKDSDRYCYPHSRWYRPAKVYWNRFVSWLDNLVE